MLFLASRILKHELNDDGRLHLLEKLAERKFLPLIRSTRLACYAQALSDSTQAEEIERLIATSTNAEQHQQHAPYVQGDIFCFEDHTFFLLFEDAEDGSRGMRAGIIYEPQTREPLRKLNSFCRTVGLCLADADYQFAESPEDDAAGLSAWRQDAPVLHQGFIRFVAKQDADSLSTIACRENARERVRAAKLLDDDETLLTPRQRSIGGGVSHQSVFRRDDCVA